MDGGDASPGWREGAVELQSVQGPELSNPFDPSSAQTGNTCFILSEVYESEAGVTDHFAQSMENWKDFSALGAWLQKCKVTGLPTARIVNSLW